MGADPNNFYPLQLFHNGVRTAEFSNFGESPRKNVFQKHVWKILKSSSKRLEIILPSKRKEKLENMSDSKSREEEDQT